MVSQYTYLCFVFVFVRTMKSYHQHTELGMHDTKKPETNYRRHYGEQVMVRCQWLTSARAVNSCARACKRGTWGQKDVLGTVSVSPLDLLHSITHVNETDCTSD